MRIPKKKWQWKPKQKWLSMLVTILAMAVSTVVVQCKSDGSITFETVSEMVDSTL